jgi:2-amino-4-hydroxy-6-hydroxymethyldihydropteridine diphosphokinase
MSNTAYIALGSNIEDRFYYLYQAVRSLDQHPEITVTATSSIYETEPVGYTNQDAFLNMVIKVNTHLSPLELFKVIQNIEQENGRKREIKWGPRTLDLDILLYNQENIETEHLTVPHPRMMERAFVLVPLCEIDCNVKIPIVEKPVHVLIDELQDKKGVYIWKQKSGEDVFELFAN